MNQTPQNLLANSDEIYSAADVSVAINKLALDITEALSESNPIVMSVMGGAVVFTGQLLPKLNFPLAFDYVQANRYHGTSGQDLVWRVEPSDKVKGRVVLLLDDILDEGITLAEIKAKCLAMGAKQVLVAVLSEKILDQDKPIRADFVGLELPNRYVFGCGMDAYGWWRNLPSIRAIKDS
jgi:hypoxanthine phosphoribosyltransferase